VPRARGFEPEEALNLAMELFWLKGYSDTSIDDFVRETGASGYGLYTAFALGWVWRPSSGSSTERSSSSDSGVWNLGGPAVVRSFGPNVLQRFGL
jgi:Bacterial regulatory proteins, tetR family